MYIMCFLCIVVTPRSFSFLQQQKPATIVFTAYSGYTNANALRVLHSSAFIVYVIILLWTVAEDGSDKLI